MICFATAAQALGIGAVVEGAHERLARQLQQDPPERGPSATRPRAYSPTGEAREAADDDVLAGLRRELGAQLLDRLAVVLVGVDVLLVEQHDLLDPLAQLALDDLRARMFSGLSAACCSKTRVSASLASSGTSSSRTYCVVGERGDVQRDVAGEGDEVLVVGDEVGVAVDLDEHADLAVGVDVGLDGALGGLAAGELADLVAHLDAQDLDGLVDVAAGLLQGLLAVHHPRAGLLAQGLDVLGGDLDVGRS